MPESTLDLIEARKTVAQGILEQAETWKASHTEAMIVRDLEDLIVRAIALASDLRSLVRTLNARMQVNQLDEPFLTREQLWLTLVAAWATLQLLEKCVVGATSRGYTVDGANDCRVASERTEAMVAWMNRYWPSASKLFDPKELQEAIDQAARGEYVSHEEAWAALRRNES